MRPAHVRHCAAAALLAVTPAATHAAITASFQPVTIPQNAIDNDPQLANMQTWDIMVTTDGNWQSAGMEAVLPAGFNFYNHVLGGNTRPSPALLPAFPAVAFDTFVTAPADHGATGAPAIFGGFPEGQPLSMSGNRLSVSWGDSINDPPGTYQIARLTFPRTVNPQFHPESRTSQTNPDSTALLQPFGPFFVHWVTNADGSWHDGANWSTGTPPNGNYFVTLDVGGAVVRTVTHSQGRTAVHGIQSQEHIVVAGGTISTVQVINVANGLTLNGGTVQRDVIGSPVTVGPNGGRLEGSMVAAGLIFQGGAPLVVRDNLRVGGIGATLGAGSSIRFENSSYLDGPSSSNPLVVTFDGGGAIDVAGGATLSLFGNATLRGHGGTIAARTPGTVGAVTLVNQGRIHADVAGGSLSVAADAVASHGSLTAAAGAALDVTGALTAHAGTIGGDGAVRARGGLNVTGTITKPGAGPLRVDGQLVLAPGNAIDLLGGGIVIDYAGASPLPDIRAKIVSGYANNTWTGNGIRSATASANDHLAVGYAEASALFSTFPATFMGEGVDATAVLARLVRNGDANLDRIVNLADFNRLAGGFGMPSGALWDDGDFNYDGAVNLADFNLLAANFGLSASGAAVTPSDWAALASAVPEPARAALFGIALAAVVRRRRQWRRCQNEP